MRYKAWLRAYLEVVDDKSPECPTCGDTSVAVRLFADPDTRIGFGFVWCTSCRKGASLSRLEVPAGFEFVAVRKGEDAPASELPDIDLSDDR